MPTVTDIDKFTKFIENNKGLLASISIFAALAKYLNEPLAFNIPNTDEQTISFMRFLIIFLFVFLAWILLVKCYNADKKEKKQNIYFALFLISLGGFISLFTLLLVGNMIIPLFKLIFSVGVFYFIIVKADYLHRKYIEKIKSLVYTILIPICGIFLIYIYYLTKHLISEFFALGIFSISLSIVVFMILLPSFKLIKLLLKFFRKLVKYIYKLIKC